MEGASGDRPWKNDPRLNGPWDTLTDLGSHVADICLYLMKDKPLEKGVTSPTEFGRAASGHPCATAPQIQRRQECPGLDIKNRPWRRQQSGVHGPRTKGTVTWRFWHPDEVVVGSRGKTSILRVSRRIHRAGLFRFTVSAGLKDMWRSSGRLCAASPACHARKFRHCRNPWSRWRCCSMRLSTAYEPALKAPSTYLSVRGNTANQTG